MNRIALSFYASTYNLSLSVAIDDAVTAGRTIGKYADPTEGAREGLSAEESLEIAQQDVSLIWISGLAE